MVAVAGVSSLGVVGGGRDREARSVGRSERRRSAGTTLLLPPKQRVPFPSGQNTHSTRSAGRLQLLPVSLSTTHSYEPRNGPPPRPRLLQQLHAQPLAGLRISTTTTSATRSAQHRSPAVSTYKKPSHCFYTHCWHGDGFTDLDNALRRLDDALLHDYMSTPPRPLSRARTTQ